MAALRTVGAVAPGQPLPRSDKADVRSVGRVGGQEQETSDDFAAAAVQIIARATQLGIAVQPLADGWLLRQAGGASIGVVHGVDALAAVVGGFELAVADARELVNRLRRCAQ